MHLVSFIRHPLLLCAALLGTVESATVYLFRHCVRSINVSELAAYSARPLPSFGVPKDSCLPRGIRILEDIGVGLRHDLVLDSTVLIADNVTRNIDSANALARGLGLPANSPRIDGNAFLHCTPPSTKEEQALLEQQLRQTPLPTDASAMVAQIDAVLGSSKHITRQPDQIEGDKLKGVHALASSAADLFLMQFGGGMEVGWGDVSGADVYRLNQMQVYDWAITRRALPIEQAKSSKMLVAILEALGPGSKTTLSSSADSENTSTTIFVGHDTDVNGVGTLLDVGWKAPPFGDNTTAPSAGLRFESFLNGTVAIDFVYPLFDSNATGVLNSSPVSRSPAAALCAKAQRAIDWSCASPPTRAPDGSGLCSPEPTPAPPGPAPGPSRRRRRRGRGGS
jgi:hypothetical protein